MNYIWPFFIIVSFIFALFSGTVENLNNSVLSYTESVIKLILILLGNMCLWCGIIKIIQNTNIISFLQKALKPILKLLYKDTQNNKKAMEAISINTISNIIGIGNASTSSGIKAMEEMQKENPKKDELTNSMCMLIVLNTASIQLIPTTILAIRTSLGSSNPSLIIPTIWISTFVGTFVGIISLKLMILRKDKKI